MNFNKHSNLEGKHAYLSPSKYSWIRYSDEQIEENFKSLLRKVRGTQLHEYAKNATLLGRKQPRNDDTVNMFINDSIGYRMTPELPLYYSPYCFGTCDAVSFSRNKLRIHDLKTGVTPAKMDQLAVYQALFCLEYELRIYQNNQIYTYVPEIDETAHIIDRIVTANNIIRRLESEESSWYNPSMAIDIL